MTSREGIHLTVRGGRVIAGEEARSGNRRVVPTAGVAAGSGEVPLISGMEGVVRDLRAASQEISNMAKNTHVMVNQHQQMYARRMSQEGTPATGGITQRGLTEAMSSAIVEAEEEVQASTWLPRPEVPVAGWRTSPAHRGHEDPLPVEEGPDRPQRFEDLYPNTFRGGRSVTNMRRDFASRLQERMGNLTFGRQLEQDPLGNWRERLGEGVYGDAASEREVESFMRRQSIQGSVRGAVQGMAEGQTMRQVGLNMLPRGAIGAAAGVGAAAFAIDKVGDFAEQQRRQNAQFQAIYGGTNLGATGQRFQQQMFRWGQFGMMGDQEAEQLFMGVSQTGMQGDQRQRALDFATQQYRETGQSIAQSLEIIQTAARTGQEALSGLAGALREVTDDASEAGVNTEQARQTFVDAWSSFSTIMGGQAAVVTAQGFAQAQAGLGREFQGMDFTGMASMEMLRRAAASQGMPLNQFLAATRRDENFMIQATEDLHRRDLTARVMPQGQAAIQQASQAAGGEMSEAQIRELGTQLMETGQVTDIQGIIRTLEQFGVRGATPETAVDYLIQVMTGQWSPAREAQEAREGQRTRQFDADVGMMTADWTGSPYRRYGGELGDLAEEVRGAVPKRGPFGLFQDEEIRAISEAALADIGETERRGGISEALIRDPSQLAGIKRVQVETEDGPRVVTLEEAMRHFRDQIDAGTAQVVEGDQRGVTVAEATGMYGDEGVTVTSATEAPTDIGMDPEEWARQQRQEGGEGGGGEVVLGLTEEARRILQPVYQNGPVSYESDYTPNNPHVPPGSRPTGGR